MRRVSWHTCSRWCVWLNWLLWSRGIATSQTTSCSPILYLRKTRSFYRYFLRHWGLEKKTTTDIIAYRCFTEEKGGGCSVNQSVVSSWRLIWSKETLASPSNLSRRILPPHRYTLRRTPMAFTSSGFTRGSRKLSMYCGDVPWRTRVLRRCFFDGNSTSRTWLPPIPSG